MCGVAGIYSLDGTKINDLEFKLKKILKEISHRGPDQNGIYISKKQNCGLANNRLAIVSPNEKIKLPFSKNENHYLSFNGEIYNHRDIKNKLISKKINFDGSTDTEVLYEYLINNNSNNYEDLNGMWSFVFYNDKEHKLLMSRDLLGEKHLFYTIQKNELIFCSEIDPIINLIKDVKIDHENLIGAWKFNIPLPGHTLINNIFRMRAGENIVIQNNSIKKFDNSSLKPETWFKFFKEIKNENDVFEKFEEIFTEELKLRIPTDVSFFSTLSGGVDSTTLNYFLSKLSPNFNSIFGISNPSQNDKKDNLISEVQLSCLVSKLLKTNHLVENLYEKKGYELLRDNASTSFDGCFDPGLANIMALAESVRKRKSKVFFFADGPDELLSGYISDLELNRIDKFLGKKNKQRKLSLIKKSEILKFALSKYLNLKKIKDFNFSYDPFITRPNHLMSQNKFLNKIFSNYDQEKFHDFCSLDKKYYHLLEYMDFSQLRSMIYATKTLPDMFNYRLDKASMRYSVESRLPFLSKRIVEFFIAIPSKYRFSKDGSKGKMFMRNFLKSKSKELEKHVCERPKIGFGDNFWQIKSIDNKLNMKKKINEKVFNNKLFKKGTFDFITKNKKIHNGNVWNSYVLSKTTEVIEDQNKRKI